MTGEFDVCIRQVKAFEQAWSGFNWQETKQ
jgi:hypothetical protein